MTPSKLFLCLGCLAILAVGKGVKRHAAVFADHQIFWNRWNPASPARQDSLTYRVGILPMNTSNYSEAIPCDSCHMLSANSMQFFFENYFFHSFKAQLPRYPVELTAPQQDLVKAQNIPLLEMVDSLEFPLSQWFDGYRDPFIYRPSDPYTSRDTKNLLNRLGGTLGYTHLLIPTQFEMKVDPVRSNDFFGGLKYSFVLVFWNVALAYPEWVVFYQEEKKHTNLNKPLEMTLDNNLMAWLEAIPEKIKSLRAQEPR